MGPRDQVQAGRSCPALAGGRLDRLWPASREWRHRRLVVWIWNVTSDRAGSAELNAPPDTVIGARWRPRRTARRRPGRSQSVTAECAEAAPDPPLSVRALAPTRASAVGTRGEMAPLDAAEQHS